MSSNETPRLDQRSLIHEQIVTGTKPSKKKAAPLYTVKVWDDGSTECSCMGWRFTKGAKATKRCKHTDWVVLVVLHGTID